MADSPQQFGKYRILEELGAGGFASVYKAVDTTLDREVALKLLYPPLLTDRHFVQNFRLEAKTLAALRHPHIITIYEVGEVDNRLYIAMDLAHGMSLAKSIGERGHLPWEDTLALLKQVCEALDYAHCRGVIHRDLKPANILLDERGVLLTDFGFARLMAESSVSVSRSGGIVGTPGYIAPEVWELNAADVPVDLYALGCIVYEMLTGDMLFKGPTPMQAMYAHGRGPQFPAVWPGGVPANITEVLGKALARDPSARYPSAGALWHALNDLETQAEAAREVAQREALIAQWRTAAEQALETKEWDAARMAIGRWRAVAPRDPAIDEVQKRLELLTTPPPAATKPAPPPPSNSAAQGKVLTDLHEEVASQSQVAPVVLEKSAPILPDDQPIELSSPTSRGRGSKIAAGVGGLIVIVLLAVVFLNSRTSIRNTSTVPTVAQAATAAPASQPLQATLVTQTARAKAAQGALAADATGTAVAIAGTASVPTAAPIPPTPTFAPTAAPIPPTATPTLEPSATAVPSVQSDQRCFPETGQCMAGRIREYWEENGGLPVFGFPITAQREERSEGGSFQAQWFETNRLELHPENERPYDVLLGRLGADRLAQQGRDWTLFAKSEAQSDCRFFPETGHNVCGDMLKVWRARGVEFDGRPGKSEAESLLLFGLPLSDVQTETIDGKELQVQWFERARLELHPENAPPYNVLLGLLGNEVLGSVR